MRVEAICILAVIGCGRVEAHEEATAPDAGPEPAQPVVVSGDASTIAVDAADAALPIDCDGDRFRVFCYGDASAETRWGFDARCAMPTRDGGSREAGIPGCYFTHTRDGLGVMCCDDRGSNVLDDGGEP